MDIKLFEGEVYEQPEKKPRKKRTKKESPKPLPGINRGYNPLREQQQAVRKVLEEQKDTLPTWQYVEETVTVLRHVMLMYPSTSQAPRLTGEKDLVCTGVEFLDKIQHNPKGLLYIKAFEVYIDVLIHTGILSVRKRENIPFVYVPEWDLLITALDVYTLMHGNM